jgi:hypothetical protein
MNSNSNNQSISNEITEDKQQVPNQNLPTAKPTSTKDSFVKLAMRNMVKKGSTSLFHFFLTIVGVIGALLGLAIAFH